MIGKIPYLAGIATFKSGLSIEEVGDLISEKLFGGLKFIGKEKEIYEEVPAIFIESNILGLRIVLSGYSGIEKEKGFALEVYPAIPLSNKELIECRLDSYVTMLLKEALKDTKEIEVIDI